MTVAEAHRPPRLLRGVVVRDMGSTVSSFLLSQPVGQTERYRHLDVLRGFAFFGVLLVNLLTLFRVSLFQHILEPHTHAGWANHVVDVAVAAFVEFKAFTLFAFLFGVGIAIQAERRVDATWFLVRRFLVLMGFGVVHMFLIWNGDILMLYAGCGLMMAGAIRWSPRILAALGMVAVAAPLFVPLGFGFPGEQALRAHVAEANRVYGHGGYFEIVAFRWKETWALIMPLGWGVLPRTLGIMFFGAAAWRSGLLRHPEKHRRLLWTVVTAGGVAGGGTSLLSALGGWSGGNLHDLVGTIPLSFAYAAAVLLWVRPGRGHAIGAAGQMALTNYLMHSTALGFVFYGYGLGLFGRLGPAAGAAMAVVLYGVLVAFSVAWLGQYRFGPFEWVWRRLTYGRGHIIPLAK
jgi:uncharacterized protein